MGDIETSRQLKALGDFLRQRRAELCPALVGLPEGHNRRRTPGLRREEVAQLAGVSPAWYTKLEQGRAGNVSKEILRGVCDALHLDAEERTHLLRLAYPIMPAGFPSMRSVPSTIRCLLDHTDLPMVLFGHHLEILEWNPAAASTLIDFASVPVPDRNILWLTVTDPALRARFLDREAFARQLLGLFRMNRALYPDDPWFDDFIQRLEDSHPSFSLWWKTYEARSAVSMDICVHHPKTGLVQFNLHTLYTPDEHHHIPLYMCIGVPQAITGRVRVNPAGTGEPDAKIPCLSMAGRESVSP